MPMKNPVHPGEIIRHECLEPLGLTVTAAADVLSISRQALNNVVNGKAAVSPEMAVRLAAAFGSTAETWLQMQAAYDLARLRARPQAVAVVRYTVSAPPPVVQVPPVFSAETRRNRPASPSPARSGSMSAPSGSSAPKAARGKSRKRRA
jgi:antitoxin HigA-1